MNETLLTKEELAVRLGLSVYEVNQLRIKKNMPSIPMGRGFRYNLEDVNTFIKKLGKK